MPVRTAHDLRRLLEGTFTVIPEKSNEHEVTIICPEPTCGDRSGNRGIAVRSLLTNCWRCGKGGHLGNWAKRLGYALDLEEGERLVGATIDEVAGMLDQLNSVQHAQPVSGYVPSVDLPDGFTYVKDELDCAYARLIGKMARQKNLELEDLIAEGVGFTRARSKWEPYAIFPVFEWGRPVYYQGRTYTKPKDGGTTKKFPDRDELTLGSRYWIHGIDELREHGGTPIIVESILNRVSLKKELRRRGIEGFIPLCIFKHKVSPQQFAKINQTRKLCRELGKDVQEIVLMYDGRTRKEVDAGVPGSTIRTAYEDAKLFVNGYRTSVVKLPDMIDPNDNAEIAVDHLLNRRHYSQVDGLNLNLG